METKSAWLSKINWTQGVAFLTMMLTVFGIEVPDDVKIQIVTGITATTSIATWVFRTWFTK